MLFCFLLLRLGVKIVDSLYIVGIIVVCSLVTLFVRYLPFVYFGNRELPKSMIYLQNALPSAIMVILVIYCLKDVKLGFNLYDLKEIIACLVVIILQLYKKNMYISIVGGTLCYMIILRMI